MPSSSQSGQPNAFIRLAHVAWSRRWALSVILLTVFVVNASGVLRRFDVPLVDKWLTLREAAPATDVRIVAVTDDEYEREWEDSARRADLLTQLLTDIAHSQPRVIGVDVSTHADEFRRLADIGRVLRVPIIWARNADPPPSDGQFVTPQLAVGGATVTPPSRTGLALAFEGGDGVVRDFPRMLATAAGPRPSFHWSIIAAACLRSAPWAICSLRHAISAMDNPTPLLSPLRPRAGLRPISVAALREMAAAGPLSVFRDRVVLVGVAAQQARDMHRTALGELSGVELWGYAVQAEVEGRYLVKVSKAWLVLIEIAMALVMLAVQTFIGGRLAVGINVLAAPVLMMLGSLAVFSAFGLLLLFAPVTLGMLVHQLYDQFHHA